MNVTTEFPLMHRRAWWRPAAALVASLVVTTAATAGVSRVGAGSISAQNTQAAAAGVLPAIAQPFGFTLNRMAKLTANFNMSDHSGLPPEQVDGVGHPPIQMLYTTPSNQFVVRQGTLLYVPVLGITNSPPVFGAFPDINKRNELLNYVYGASQLGMQYAMITINGQTFSLDDRYIAAAQVDTPLPDGGGNSYITAAAFLKPLPPGRHKVEVSASLTGAALEPIGGAFTFSIVYDVTVL